MVSLIAVTPSYQGDVIKQGLQVYRTVPARAYEMNQSLPYRNCEYSAHEVDRGSLFPRWFHLIAAARCRLGSLSFNTFWKLQNIYQLKHFEQQTVHSQGFWCRTLSSIKQAVFFLWGYLMIHIYNTIPYDEKKAYLLDVALHRVPTSRLCWMMLRYRDFSKIVWVANYYRRWL